MAQGPLVRIGGVWKELTNVHVRIAGTWRTQVGVHTRIGGVWKDASPIYQQTDEWTAIWSQSYQGNGNKRNDVAGSQRLYHGHSSIWGTFKGAFGFDFADIQSTLSGRTIDSVELTLQNDHFYYATGYIRMGGHAMEGVGQSGPTTFSSVYNYDDATRGYESDLWTRGDQRTVGLPTAVGENFRDGTIKGLYTGQSNTETGLSFNYYGYCIGVDDGYYDALRPVLTIVHSP
jgi:hypothetical protein